MVNRAAGEQQGRFQRVMFQNMLVLLSLSIRCARSSTSSSSRAG